jgi:aminomethyltransferase
MGELRIRGAAALAGVDRLVTNDAMRLQDGRAMYTACCDATGGILDDLIVYREAGDDVLVVCNASNREKIVAHMRAELDPGLEFVDESDATALIALQGPRAAEIFEAAGATEVLRNLSPFGLGRGEVCGLPALAARTGYTGEDGYEIFCPAANAPQLWQGLFEVGAGLGLVPAGLGARDTLRLEAKLCLYGNDIDESTNPYEAGLGWVVKLDAGDFIGRTALQAIKESGVERRLVGFEMVGRGIARHAHPIVDIDSGGQMGEVTSGSPAPTLSKNIGLGYVPLSHRPIGSHFGVEIRGKVVEAVVVKTPFYRRER